MAAINNLTSDNDESQDPPGSNSNVPPDTSTPQPTGPIFPYPDLDSVPAGNQALSNARIILIGSMVISHLLVGYPPRADLKDADLVMAGRYLWYWYLAMATTRTKREFIKRLGFLLWG